MADEGSRTPGYRIQPDLAVPLQTSEGYSAASAWRSKGMSTLVHKVRSAATRRSMSASEWCGVGGEPQPLGTRG